MGVRCWVLVTTKTQTLTPGTLFAGYFYFAYLAGSCLIYPTE